MTGQPVRCKMDRSHRRQCRDSEHWGGACSPRAGDPSAGHRPVTPGMNGTGHTEEGGGHTG